jgi:hypothetical protein
VVISFIACNSNAGKKQSLIGKWKPVEMNFQSMREDEKKELIENTIIEFAADGKFIANRNQEKREGTYTYDEKNQKLTTIMKEGKTEQFTISWEGDKLVITSPEGVVKMNRQ